MKRTAGIILAALLSAGFVWADSDGDAVLDQARREYQESVNEEQTDEGSGSTYRYERETTERESWSMESDSEPDWWTEGVDNDTDGDAAPADTGAAAQASQDSSRSATPNTEAAQPVSPQTVTPEQAVSSSPAPRRATGPELKDFRPATPIRRIDVGPSTESDEVGESLTYVPFHLSVFGETWGGPISANLAVSPLISAIHTVNGIQAAGIIATVDDEARGFQLGGVFATSGGDVEGLQSAGVFAVAEEDLYGIQSSGVFNTVEGDLSGVQTAGVFNTVEGSVRGLQAAGVFNTAGDLTGGQIGVVNVAKEVRGVQIGLVNISDTMYGLPIGLINIVRNGIRNFTVWFEDTGYNYVGYQYGSNIFYTIAYGGLHEEDWFESYGSLVTGLGLGMRVKRGALFVDADVSAKHVAAGETDGEKLSHAFAYDATTYPAARLTAGIRLGQRLAFFGGASIDVHIPGVTQRGMFHTGEMVPVSEDGFAAELYPKGFIGFSF